MKSPETKKFLFWSLSTPKIGTFLEYCEHFKFGNNAQYKFKNLANIINKTQERSNSKLKQFTAHGVLEMNILIWRVPVSLVDILDTSHPSITRGVEGITRKKESILPMLLSLLRGTERDRDICFCDPFLCNRIFQHQHAVKNEHSLNQNDLRSMYLAETEKHKMYHVFKFNCLLMREFKHLWLGSVVV